jgi:hypothetical protein
MLLQLRQFLDDRFDTNLINCTPIAQISRSCVQKMECVLKPIKSVKSRLDEPKLFLILAGTLERM